MQTKSILTFLFIAFVLIGCGNKLSEIELQQSKIIAKSKNNKETRARNQVSLINDSIVFTGNDIAWFNSKTREIKFTKVDPAPFSLPIRGQIDVYIGVEKLFSCIHINGSENASYNDLVLFYDLGSKRYFLKDYYPDNFDPEGVKKNITAREKGWNKFLNQLKDEKKLK